MNLFEIISVCIILAGGFASVKVDIARLSTEIKYLQEKLDNHIKDN